MVGWGGVGEATFAFCDKCDRYWNEPPGPNGAGGSLMGGDNNL